ncbi:MAG: substrate-binding domain-containing protein [Pseudolysinimonas sp.]
MRRPVAAALAVALATLSLVACTSPDPGPPATVAVALPSDAGRWSEVAQILRDRLQAVGYTVDVRMADGDIPTQVRQVDELLAAGPRALIVAPVDVTSLTAVIDGADPDLEVISLGTMVRDTGAVDGFVGFDAALEGQLQARSLLQGLGLVDDAGAAVTDAPAGPFEVELFAGSLDDERTEPSFAAAVSVLQPYVDAGTLVVPSGQLSLEDATTLRGDGATAAARMRQLVTDSYPTGLPAAVLTPSDEIARAVADVLLEDGAVAGVDFPVLSGRGAELRSLAALVDGRQYATLLEDPSALAGVAVDRVVDALVTEIGVPLPSADPQGVAIDNGARMVPASLLSPALVRVEDIDAVVVDSGYWSRDRIDKAIAESGSASG